jgi:hypothetical protein
VLLLAVAGAAHACCIHAVWDVCRGQEEEVAAIANGAHFDTVLASGSVEYVDVNEENDIMVCLLWELCTCAAAHEVYRAV